MLGLQRVLPACPPTQVSLHVYLEGLETCADVGSHMAAANSTPPSSLEVNQPGFPKELLGTELEVKYLCSECKNILRRPFQAQCGHRYCSYCLKKIISSGPQKCAACIQEGIYEPDVSVLESSSTFPDNAARREVESLQVLCIHEGCAWKGTLKEYESCHEGSCPFMLVACPACQSMTRLSEKERHAERECPERSLNCKYCKVLCYFPDIKAHDEVCPKFPLTCEGCGKKKIPREKFQEHVKTCSRCKAPCRFQPVGCTEMVENERLPEHEVKRLGEHLYMLLSFVLSLRSDTGKLQPLPGLPSSSLAEAGPALLGGSPLVSDSELQNSIGLLGRCEALERKTVTFENIVCVLNREVERVSLAAETYSRQHQADQEKIEALSSKVRLLERSIALKDLALAEMERTIQEMEASSFDGVFIWKITDIARKRQEAISGRSPAIFSPAFYTSKYGYKMCLRIYLNGDGTGRGTHLSLFFVVMKGPSDALLRWPFNQKVTLMLLDQNNREHVIDAFRPDVTSSSFQRPVSDMNIASGCPLFCPIAKMESKNSYVRDDTLFIKAIVDLTGL